MRGKGCFTWVGREDLCDGFGADSRKKQERKPVDT